MALECSVIWHSQSNRDASTLLFHPDFAFFRWLEQTEII